MATAKPRAIRQPRRWKLLACLAVIVSAFVALAWFWRPLSANAIAGASYGARTGCSCRHISGRSLASCRDDFEPGMGLVSLSEDAEKKSVTASVALLARQTATFRPGEGCVLERWSR